MRRDPPDRIEGRAGGIRAEALLDTLPCMRLPPSFARLASMLRRTGPAAALLAGAAMAHADGGLLHAFQTAGDVPPPPWTVAGLPHQTKPFTQFSIVDIDGRGHRVLRVDSDNAYGNLVHPLHLDAPGLHLAWSWKVEQLVDAVDLRTREGDDTALKVCVFFDLPLQQVPFVERQVLRVARANTGEALPAATVCYVWDARLAAGTTLPSAFTKRLRYKVLRSGSDHLHQWSNERRDVAADFLELFGNESTEVPPITGVAVGADADNTHGHSLGFVSDLTLER